MSSPMNELSQPQPIEALPETKTEASSPKFPSESEPSGSRFLTSLKVEELDDTSNDGRGTWQLLGDLVYESQLSTRVIIVPTGFITDYASVPRVPIAYMLVGDTAHKAAVVHDWLYTCHMFDQATSDAILKEAALASGVPSWRANIIYAGVRIGGRGPYEADATKQPELVRQQLDLYENSVKTASSSVSS